MSRSLKFAAMLAERLRSGTVIAVRGQHYTVRGELCTTAVYVPIEVRVPWYFRYHKRRPPTVWCRQPWMRSEPDWHNGPGGMCWVLDQEWRDHMLIRRKPVKAILQEGRDWLIKSVTLLVDRHYLAHRKGFTRWRPEWACWSHYGAGLREYRRSRARSRRLA